MNLPIVDSILEKHWDWTLPVSIENIAMHLGINIPDLPSDLEHKNLSSLAQMKDGKRSISCNKSESLNRQRFALAHALGHHILQYVTINTPKLSDKSTSFSSVNQSEQNTEANNFAIQLLMPSEAIRLMIFRKGITDISILASQFQVSEAAMHLRIKNMGLLS